MVMKVRYAIIEPDHALVSSADGLEWRDAEFKTEDRTIDHGPDAPEQVPTYESTKAFLQPFFPGRDTEHVAVNGFNGPADMFVDDCGMIDGFPVNNCATLVYWTATILRQIRSVPGFTAVSDVYQVRQRLALRLGVDVLRQDRETPRIHGRAVLFDGRIWY